MRESILRRYRALRPVATAHTHAAVRMLARNAVLDTARSLGLAHRGTLLIDNDSELELIFDLCLHTARPGRSRALDRFARAASFVDGSDEAVVLAAMQQARFSIWRIVRRAPDCGLIVEDTMRGGEAWVVDQALTATAAPGVHLGGRLFTPGAFGIWCAMPVLVTAEVVAETMATVPAGFSHMETPEVADDYRYATALYRAAVTTNTLNLVRPAVLPAAA